MAFQLVYTSAPRGLKPGAFGFCVVACSRGMKEQTISALEALSGYRRVYADPRDASRNPTSRSHVIIETATGRLRILARVADAGLDYSGRTNKIASFLSVAESELAPPGPAALFSQPNLFVKNWSSSDAPRYYDAPIALPNYVPIPSGCEGWRAATGDPAWAGVLASTVATRRPVVLVVRPDLHVLRLFQESLALLPPSERWNATFSTYYMKTPPGVQCQWKAVMRGSPEELQLRAAPGALVLDLAEPGRLPNLDSLVASPQARALVAAASGRSQGGSASPRPVQNVPPAAPRPSTPFSASPSDATPQVVPNAAPLPGAAPIGAPPSTGASPGSAHPYDEPVSSQRKTLDYGRDLVLKVETPKQRGSFGSALALRLALCAGLLLILLGVALGIMYKSGVFKTLIQAKKTVDELIAETNGRPLEPTPPFDDGSDSPSSSKDRRGFESTDPEKDVQGGEKSGLWIGDETDDDPFFGFGGDEPDEKRGDRREIANAGDNDEFDAIANEIELALTTFTKEGGLKNLETARRLLRENKDAKELIAARNRFNRVEDALKFRALQNIFWNGKDAKKRLSSGDVVVRKGDFYKELENFFSAFNLGRVVLTFRLYDENGESVETLLTIAASEFRKAKNNALSEPIELFFRDDSEDAFYVDLQRRDGALRFQSEDSARSWLLRGTYEFAAYANSDPDDGALVFSSKEKPLLNASDLNSEESLELDWLFDKAPLLSNDKSAANTLFLEYLPVGSKSALKVEKSTETFQKMRGAKKNRFDASRLVALRYQEARGRGTLGGLANATNYVFLISFTIGNSSRIEDDGVSLFVEDLKDGWRDASEGGSLPSGLVDQRVLTFNVRYRAFGGQRTEDAPILGVLKVPLELDADGK